MIPLGIFAVRMKVLVISPRFPYPLEKGDKLRLYQQLKQLATLHEIHLFAISHQPARELDLDELSPYCSSIVIHHITRWQMALNMLKGFFSGLPFSVAYFTDQTAIRSVQKYYTDLQPDLVYGQLIRIGEYLKPLSGHKVIDMMDAFSVIMAQRAQRASLLLRPFLHLEASRLARYEQTAPEWSDKQTFISLRDWLLIDAQQQWSARIIPNGIDTAFFHASSSENNLATDLTFIGNLGYYPNRVAALFLVKKIMPLIWKVRPETTLLIAGARPTKDIVALQEGRVRIIPWLDDIRDGYLKGSLFIAPIQLGAGLQNKILEAMAMELPVLTTSHVNQAIGASPGSDILIADTAEEFATSALAILDSPERTIQLVNSALTFVRSNYSWETSVNHLDEYVFKSFLYPTDAS